VYGSALSCSLCPDETDVFCRGLLATSHVERNRVRAGMVRWATDYRWSSAALPLAGEDESGTPDIEPSRESQ
jgi:hypothetical protein